MSVTRNRVDRDFRHGMRRESAKRCIGSLSPRCEVFGLTKGDFSMIDMLRHCAREIGPCHVDIGTWTAAGADIRQAEALLKDGRIRSMRWLVDRSFPRRQPEFFHQIAERFGRDTVRIARFHAKFIVMKSDTMDLAIRTSMNLNENRRIESYEISEGTPISDYLREIVDAHFAAPLEDDWRAFLELKVGEAQTEDSKHAQQRLGAWD